MPVAEATALSFLSPVVTMGLAIVLLGEYLTLRKVIAASLALAGAVLILRPGVEAFQPAGLLALVAAGCMGLEAIYIKRLSDSESALRILLINNMVGALISVVVASTVWLWPVPNQWALLVCAWNGNGRWSGLVYPSDEKGRGELRNAGLLLGAGVCGFI